MISVPRSLLLLTAAFAYFLLSHAVFAQPEILFEDTFDGVNGTVLATGPEETYRIVGRDGTLMTPTIEDGRLALSMGPNPSEAHSFSALHHNTRFDFQAQPLLFEVDVDLGDRRNFVFALHRSQNQTRIEGNGNSLTVGFFDQGNRLSLTARDPAGEETTKFQIHDLPKTSFRLGVYLDKTDVKLLFDGILRYSAPHGLSLEAFDLGAYVALQMHGGGEQEIHTAYVDNLRVIANPDVTPKPTVLFSDTFDGENGTVLPTGPNETYRIVERPETPLTPTIEDGRLALKIGPRPADGHNFAVLNRNDRFDFLNTPMLFEVDVDLGDAVALAFGLHTSLANTRIDATSNQLVVNYYTSGNRLVLSGRNGGQPIEANYEIPEVEKREFKLGIYLDATEVMLWIDEVKLYSAAHNLSPTAFASGGFLGLQLYGGGNGQTHTAYFDNLQVTAHPALPEILLGDVYWSTATEIRSLHFESGEVQTIVGGLGRPIGVSVDFENEHLYWVEHDTGLLMRANTDGSNVTEIRSGLQTGQFLAVDATAGELFWAEWTTGLHSSLIDGSNPNVLIGDPGNGNAGVAVTEEAVYLLSANTGAVTFFARDNTWTTGNVTTFAGQSYSIALDPSNREMFATNFTEGWIRAYDLQEDTTRTVWDEGLSRPLGITVSSDGKKLFWVERTLDVTNGRIRMANADGTGTIETLVEGEASPFGIAVRPFSEAPAGFAGWIAGFDLGEGENGPDDAPAGDGIPNLLKYALGLNPLQSARELLPQPEIRELVGHEHPGSGHLTLSVERNPDALGIGFVFEVSQDLVNWSSDEADVLVEEDGDTLTAWSTATIDEDGRQFLRFRIVTE